MVSSCNHEKLSSYITLYGVHGGEVTLAQENGRYQHFRLHPLEVKNMSIHDLHLHPLRIFSTGDIIVVLNEGKMHTVIPKVTNNEVYGTYYENSSATFYMEWEPVLTTSSSACTASSSVLKCIPSVAKESTAHSCLNNKMLHLQALNRLSNGISFRLKRRLFLLQVKKKQLVLFVVAHSCILQVQSLKPQQQLLPLLKPLH